MKLKCHRWEKPRIVFKEMPLNWTLVSGEWHNKTDTIYINTKFGKFIQKETYFHEMLHRKIHEKEIFGKKEATATIFEELFCVVSGWILAVWNWNHNWEWKSVAATITIIKRFQEPDLKTDRT
ncbi:MAG: hypothetical protein HY376_02910 [Candidatus Blackburnbacteria bacterium]|nr:hypothetical protein [Candidatus Blackburnbacteria bacterium]